VYSRAHYAPRRSDLRPRRSPEPGLAPFPRTGAPGQRAISAPLVPAFGVLGVRQFISSVWVRRSQRCWCDRL